MIDVRKRLKRILRVHGLETSRLSVLVVELARIDRDLATQKAHVVEMQAIKEQGLSAYTDCSVEVLTQTGLWIDSVKRAITDALNRMAGTESKRQQAQSRVMDQRARVRGLEILMDQLRFELDADAETKMVLLADEHALKDYTRN
jgi:hypothetical protein